MDLDVISLVKTESRAGWRLITKQQTTGINRHVEPLVRIERNRIGALNTAEQWTLRFIQRRQRAISAINVEPKIEFLCDCRNVGQLIDSAGVDSTRAGNYAKWFEVRLSDRRQLSLATTARSCETDRRRGSAEPARDPGREYRQLWVSTYESDPRHRSSSARHSINPLTTRPDQA